jgi:hypothetical protein
VRRRDGVKTLLPWLVAVAFFMESLDTTILNTAVPSIANAYSEEGGDVDICRTVRSRS